MFMHWIVVLYLTTSLLTTSSPCPVDFIPLHKSCYHFSNETATWTEAIIACTEMNSALVSIETEEEWLAIGQHVHSVTLREYWTSGTDLGAEGQFRWATSLKHFTFTKWCQGYPLKSYYKRCVLIWPLVSSICWRNYACNVTSTLNDPIHYICEY